MDPRLENEYVGEKAERILRLGLVCSDHIASDRPKVQIIVEIIFGSKLLVLLLEYQKKWWSD